MSSANMRTLAPIWENKLRLNSHSNKGFHFKNLCQCKYVEQMHSLFMFEIVFKYSDRVLIKHVDLGTWNCSRNATLLFRGKNICQ